MIADHVWRPTWATAQNADIPAAERPCRYLNCGRPSGEHERSTAAVQATDWSRYQKCSKCGAELGKPCRSLTGYSENSGSGAVVVAEADSPHGGRKLRAGASRG